jgi:hypothetical protein
MITRDELGRLVPTAQAAVAGEKTKNQNGGVVDTGAAGSDPVLAEHKRNLDGLTSDYMHLVALSDKSAELEQELRFT